jgi:carboxyl-terminal processing protease
MNRSQILTAIAGVAFVLLVTTVGISDPTDATQPASPPATLDIAALVARGDALIDVVLEQHIRPPTRQELWRGGATGLLERSHLPARGIGIVEPRQALGPELEKRLERISGLTTRDQFAKLLNDLWSAVPRSGTQRAVRELEEAFVGGILNAVPGGARLIPAKEAAVEEQLRGNRYVGTGIALNFDEKEKCPRIAVAYPGGPIQRAGGQSGDLILKVNDRDAHGFRLVDMVDLLRGEEGTVVTLVVKSAGGNERTLAVTRGPVVLPTLDGFGDKDSDYRIPSAGWVRYVKVRKINGSTVHDLRKLEQQFKSEGAAAVILDFRRDGSIGEDPHHAVMLADALIDGGSIGRLRTRHNVREFHADRDRLFRDLPVSVLVDGKTRGGPEWVAAALQDNHAATLVGETTGGFGFAFDRVPFPGSGDLLQLATGVFERAGGVPIHYPREIGRPSQKVAVNDDDDTDDADDDDDEREADAKLTSEPVPDGQGGVRPDVTLDFGPPSQVPKSGPIRRIRAPQQAGVLDPIVAAAIKELESQLARRAVRGQTSP